MFVVKIKGIDNLLNQLAHSWQCQECIIWFNTLLFSIRKNAKKELQCASRYNILSGPLMGHLPGCFWSMLTCSRGCEVLKCQAKQAMNSLSHSAWGAPWLNNVYILISTYIYMYGTIHACTTLICTTNVSAWLAVTKMELHVYNC